jgi:hypothetical protein
MVTEAFQTLDDGTLVDYWMDDEQRIVIRAGDSLIPNRRPVVLTLTPADAVQLIRILKDLYEHNPVDIALQEELDRRRRR